MIGSVYWRLPRPTDERSRRWELGNDRSHLAGSKPASRTLALRLIRHLYPPRYFDHRLGLSLQRDHLFPVHISVRLSPKEVVCSSAHYCLLYPPAKTREFCICNCNGHDHSYMAKGDFCRGLEEIFTDHHCRRQQGLHIWGRASAPRTAR